jgi:hypothetical protein
LTAVTFFVSFPLTQVIVVFFFAAVAFAAASLSAAALSAASLSVAALSMIACLSGGQVGLIGKSISFPQYKIEFIE